MKCIIRNLDKHSDWGKIIDKDYFFQKPIKNEDLIKRIKLLLNNKDNN